MEVTDSEFIEIVSNAKTMCEASATLKIQFSTFKRRALRLGCYSPRGENRQVRNRKKVYTTESILSGNHPEFQTFKLKNRLYEDNIKDKKCESCGLVEWIGLPIPLELDHVNGDRTDHRLHNLKIVCPNCHAQTTTYRALNKRSCRDKLAPVAQRQRQRA